MKTLIVKELTESSIEYTYLKNIKPDIDKTRRKFYNFLDNFNPKLKKVIINHFKERLERAGDNLLLGEYAPYILGHLFNISKSTINKVSFPWFLLYEYSLIFDDLLDKDRVDWKMELISSQKLLDYSHQEFIKFINKDNKLFNDFNKYRDQSIDGMIKEIDWTVNGIIDNKNTAILFQGRKAALVKFCVSFMIKSDKKRSIYQTEEQVLDNICAGIQIIDDLTDIVEDHNEHRINIMLSTIYEWIYKNYGINSTNISTNQLLAGLIFSNSLNTTLDISSFLLSSVKKNLKETPYNKGAIDYFNNIAISCSNSSTTLDKILIENKKIEPMLLKHIFIEKNIDKKQGKLINDYWNKLIKFIKLVPKASN